MSDLTEIGNDSQVVTNKSEIEGKWFSSDQLVSAIDLHTPYINIDKKFWSVHFVNENKLAFDIDCGDWDFVFTYSSQQSKWTCIAIVQLQDVPLIFEPAYRLFCIGSCVQIEYGKNPIEAMLECVYNILTNVETFNDDIASLMLGILVGADEVEMPRISWWDVPSRHIQS